MLKKIFTACFGAFFAVSYGLAAGPIRSLGQVVGQNVWMDGVAVPSGTTILPDTLLRTSADPAFVHVGQRHLLQLDRDSSAYFEQTSTGETRVTVRSGTVTFATAGAKTITLPPKALISLPLSGEPTASPQERVEVILMERTVAGQTSVVVNDSSRLRDYQAILLKSPDGLVQEIHYIQSFQGSQVTLTAPLQNTFEANTAVIGEASALQAAAESGVPVVGAPGGVSTGAPVIRVEAPPPGPVEFPPPEGGLSKGAIVGIVLGAGGAAAVIAAVALGESSP